VNRGLSVWLDALRVGATILVVLSHWAYPRFTGGDYIVLRDLNLGSDAVIVFFVISGLVIAYAAERDGRLATYAFNRATRLFSVLLPAVLLTFAFDRIGQRIGPEAYDNPFYNPLTLQDMLLRGLTMSNEWAGAGGHLRLGTNGPLWSLSYEAAYYVLFALAFYLSGARRAVLMLACAWLFGPRVLLLMPAWLLGVWLWRHIAAGGAARMPLLRAQLFAWGGPLLYIAGLALHLPETLAAFTAEAFAPQHYRMVLGFSDEFLWNALIGGLAALHILGMARLLQHREGCDPGIRWWAGASFSIYVTHYPALHLIDACVPAGTPGRDALLLAGSIGIGLIFAQVFERPIGRLRAGLLAARDALPLSGRRHPLQHRP
jgi:peptidoglycan/LPS O-acetylase OafA/YrhL